MEQIAYWPADMFCLPWAEPIEPDWSPYYLQGHFGFPSVMLYVTRRTCSDLARNPAVREAMLCDLRRFMRTWAARSPVLN
jgi:hypothetical protein